ncbi:MAG: TetR/AcrR family transcriptional regulator [Alphaproteobacteria bacterium]|nr:TetR/AcrR family transcriptional regulator [Alphaproteobacteria bacterium]
MSQTLQKPTKSWNRRKQARPGEILDAALEIFAEKGFAAARMEDIAARAGVTKGTIYLYFQSKEDVFKQLARQQVSSNLTLAAERAADFEGSARDFLATFLGGVAAMVVSKRHAVILPKIIIGESGNFPELASFWRTEVIDRAMAIMTGVLARGVKTGEIRGDLDLSLVARLCIAPVLLTIIWRSTFEHTDATPFDYQKFLSTHLEVLMNGLKP